MWIYRDVISERETRTPRAVRWDVEGSSPASAPVEAEHPMLCRPEIDSGFVGLP